MEFGVGFVMSVIQADIPTANGRVYPRAVLEKAIEAAQAKVASRTLLLAMGWPESAKVNLEDVVGLITSVRLINSEIVVEGMTGTPTAELLHSGKFVVRPVGVGKIDKDLNVTEYELIGMAIYLDQPASPVGNHA